MQILAHTVSEVRRAILFGMADHESLSSQVSVKRVAITVPDLDAAASIAHFSADA